VTSNRIFQTALFVCAFLGAQLIQAQVRVIEVTATRDSRYKIADESKPEITLKAGEHVLFRITAQKAKTCNRDGSIHGFTLLRAHDRIKVPGWSLLLTPGTHDFELTAPLAPGEYVVVCTVICSDDHEGMNMKLVVVP
jgi:heme/copper-type cytochrome/quinol oxidase subunit 2